MGKRGIEMNLILILLALIPKSYIANQVEVEPGQTMTMQNGTTIRLIDTRLNYQHMECIGVSYTDGMIVLEWTASVYGAGIIYSPQTMYWREFYTADGDSLILHHSEVGTFVSERIEYGSVHDGEADNE